MRSPLDLIREEVETEESQPVKVREWLEQLNDKLDLVHDAARQCERDIRKAAYDKGAAQRKFVVGDMVLLRTPGMHGKLEEAWRALMRFWRV